MIKFLRKMANQSTLAAKLRLSYIVLVVPMIFFPLIFMVNMYFVNKRYDDMINSTVVASEFSLEFKTDFDYETYLLIVENKSLEESELDNLLTEAYGIVNSLLEITDGDDNQKRLLSVKKYLNNLESYKENIERNLEEGNRYEENIVIWENDVQIVTTLVQDSMAEYIYYEVSDLQVARDAYQTNFSLMMTILMAIYLVVIILVVFTSYYLPKTIAKPLERLVNVTDQVAQGDLNVRSDVYEGQEVTVLSNSVNSMIDKINELLEQVTTEQIRLRKAEFDLLQSQINPHFLYNTLDAIVWLAEAGEEKKVVSMVESLSQFFRASLNQGKEINTLAEELQHVTSYLEIQQTRYSDILDYDINLPDEMLAYHIPKITLQPIVENAIYHGIKNKRGLGKIEVTGAVVDGNAIIKIKDNGIGIKPDRLEEIKDGIINKKPQDTDIYGMYNVNERIALNFGEEYGLKIESVYKEYTVVTVKLPCE